MAPAKRRGRSLFSFSRGPRPLAITLLVGLLLAGLFPGGGGASPSYAPGANSRGTAFPLGPPFFQVPRESVPAPRDWPATAVTGRPYSGPVHVLVEFQFQNVDRLDRELSQLQDPESPAYHHFLTLREFRQQFGFPSQLYEEAQSWFSSFSGIQVQTFPDGSDLEVSGPAGIVGNAFGIRFLTLQTPSRGSFYGFTGVPRLPAPLATKVHGLYGLDDYARASVAALRVQETVAPLSRRMVTGYPPPIVQNGVQNIWGSDLQVTYNETPLLSLTAPAGESLATILWSGNNSLGDPVAPFVPSDVYGYFNQSLPPGEPLPHLVPEPVNGALLPGPSAADDTTGATIENTLDLEMAGSLAPGATVYDVYGPSPTLADLLDAFVTAVNLNVSVISNSWGGPDTNETGWSQPLMECAALGTTVLAATGDSGDDPSSSKWIPNNPNPQGVQFPSNDATDTYGVVAVGGTTLHVGSSLQRESEVAWYVPPSDPSQGGPVGTTGGISGAFATPSWQLTSEAEPLLLDRGRGVPDLAAIANNTIVELTIDGTPGLYSVEGTSIASPVIGGLWAEIDAVLSLSGIPSRLGFVLPLLYEWGTREFQGTLALPPLYDVTVGENYAYTARPGYDLLTGWGVPDAGNMTDHLRGPAEYSVVWEETGLPAGTIWGVVVNGIPETTLHASLTMSLPNGSYPYEILDVSGWHETAVPYEGEITVTGAAYRPPVLTFTNVTYPVTFMMEGLSSPSLWRITISATGWGTLSQNVTGTVFGLPLPNGTYDYTVQVDYGELLSPAHGRVSVRGAGPSPIVLQGAPPPRGILVYGAALIFGVGLVVLLVVGVVVAVTSRRRASREGPPSLAIPPAFPPSLPGSGAGTARPGGVLHPCPRCGREAPFEANYCTDCGSSLNPQAPFSGDATAVPQRCPRCGAGAGVTQRFCTECGAQLAP
jgi:subtilase family serine protease